MQTCKFRTWRSKTNATSKKLAKPFKPVHMGLLSKKRFFCSARHFFLKTIAHTLNMSTKRKAQQNGNDSLPSLKSGRPVKAYSIADAVKMVSFIEAQGGKVDMVQGVLSLIRLKNSLSFFFLSTQILYY